ncbi:HPP family protein [uncultured Chitinophaga sp.]|uniref:HPP family protein n=1 Tax=uncultured Chitinophaga sp. TaxID=339340 RepID=UPI0025E14D5C|nr:HPP family protein [uncultured Chitinophaga sp.]
MPVKKIKRSYRKAKYILYRETLIDTREHIITFLGAFLGIGLIGFINSKYLVANENLFLIGSFGASSVLIYGVVNSPLAQPRNLIGGHLISAVIGVIFHKIFPQEVWLGGALAVALSIVAMQITKTLHPPGGATALIANMGTPRIESLGFWYVLSPVLTGVLILLAVALVVNNASKHRNYPARPLFKRRY